MAFKNITSCQHLMKLGNHYTYNSTNYNLHLPSPLSPDSLHAQQLLPWRSFVSRHGYVSGCYGHMCVICLFILTTILFTNLSADLDFELIVCNNVCINILPQSSRDFDPKAYPELKQLPDSSEVSIRRYFRKPRISIQTKIIIRNYMKEGSKCLTQSSHPFQVRRSR